MQPSSCIGPGRGVVEHLPELGREGRQVDIQPRVAPNRGYSPIQSPVGQGGDDERHLGPVGLELEGLGPDEILALLQETPTLVEVPRVTVGKRGVRCGWGELVGGLGVPQPLSGGVAALPWPLARLPD